MSRSLHIAPNLTLPIDAVTQAIGIIAKRRVGKSYTARKFCEQFLNAGQQVVIVDPKGDHWGIRSGADGKSPGLQVIILGGERGDLPLEVGAGEIIAKLVSEERVSVLLDLSLFRKHEVATFMTAFLEGLYRLKAREEFRTPLMLVIDEADAIAPQKPQPNEARMLGAAEDIVRRGGQRGIGCMMITQRSAVLNKNVLTQVEVLIALRTIAPQDLKALDAWVEVHGEEEQRNTLMASLPSLPVGDAWVWSPGWPTSDGIFKRVHVHAIETFDSGASPKAGEKRVEPKNLADVDMGALKRQMSATIEKAKADDPKELRRQLKEKDAEIARLQKAKPAGRDEVLLAASNARGQMQKELDRAVAAAIAPYVQRIERFRRAFVKYSEDRSKAAERLDSAWADIATFIEEGSTAVPESVVRPGSTSTVQATGRSSHAPARPAVTSRAPVEGVSKGQQKILNALAELEALGFAQTNRVQLGMFAGYNLTGGSGAQHISDLRELGLVDLPDKGAVRLTNAGRGAADAIDAPSSLADLHTRVYRKISDGQRRILAHLITIHPDAISRADLGAEVGYNLTGGSGAQHVADLINAGAAIIPSSGKVAASAFLFPAGLR